MEKNPRSFYRIRFSDCDPLGHLNNARYIDYFLNAREDHLKDHYNLDLKSFYAKGVSWVVSDHEIIYKKPALYNEMVCISSSLIRLFPDSLIVEMLMTDEQKKLINAIMWTSFVHVNVRTGKKENHAADFMEFAVQVENTGIDIEAGLKNRESFVRSVLSTAKVQ
jgi:YbgC/YbaW family acyl-CoA thioester hydrolase